MQGDDQNAAIAAALGGAGASINRRSDFAEAQQKGLPLLDAEISHEPGRGSALVEVRAFSPECRVDERQGSLWRRNVGSMSGKTQFTCLGGVVLG